MNRNPFGDLLQFLVGGALFCSGIFLLANQVVASSAIGFRPYRSFAGGLWGVNVPFGTPGMGLLMIPLGIGVCLLFAGAYRRWAYLMVWGSVAALGVGVLNSIRLTCANNPVATGGLHRHDRRRWRPDVSQPWRSEHRRLSPRLSRTQVVLMLSVIAACARRRAAASRSR
jgi:hypothetical protein